jgi:phytoene dehydrogenase-like protein
MSEKKSDLLIVGSGLAGLVFGALMAKSGRRVTMLEAHDVPGGFGHTFEMGKKHKFNAQFHYVWNCGEGQTVHNVLKALDLHEEVTFERYDPDGFDHMYMPGYHLRIPSDSAELVRRLTELFPEHGPNFERFVAAVNRTASGLDTLAAPTPGSVLGNLKDTLGAAFFLKATLQDVFDKFELPRAAQTLLALQWPDFLLPPNQLSFYAWVMLFTGYQRGAYFPTHHFEHVIHSLADVIRSSGEMRMQHLVTGFVRDGRRITGVKYKRLDGSDEEGELSADEVVCNMDPRRAAEMIGFEHFPKQMQKKLDYAYSPSNFMAYCTVKDIDLREHGFGKWNLFHSCHEDLNESFSAMYDRHDYSKPSFAMTTPNFLTDDTSDRPEGEQVVELLTVANYDYWRKLKSEDYPGYKRKKKEVLGSILDVIEENYVPDFRKHLAFKITGSPTTNEDFCWCPEGNSYGSNMTPDHIGLGRLDSRTSFDNFHFCNASSGYAGFAGTFWTGAALYQRLTGAAII